GDRARVDQPPPGRVHPRPAAGQRRGGDRETRHRGGGGDGRHVPAPGAGRRRPGGGRPGVRLELGPGPRAVNLGLLAALVDDAGLFPPEQLPMAAALARHRADEAAGHPMLTHRFLCPASRLTELRKELASGGGPLRLGVILDTGADGLAAACAEVAAEPLLALETVEVAAPSAEAVMAVLDAVAG